MQQYIDDQRERADDRHRAMHEILDIARRISGYDSITCRFWTDDKFRWVQFRWSVSYSPMPIPFDLAYEAITGLVFEYAATYGVGIGVMDSRDDEPSRLVIATPDDFRGGPMRMVGNPQGYEEPMDAYLLAMRFIERHKLELSHPQR